MQELTSAPQMASPYTPAGGSNMLQLAAQQPKLGTPIPGTTGGLAAKPGLTVFDNPLSQELQSTPQPTNNPQAQQAAQQTQSYGRGQDTVLVHMTPEEVNSLKGLAQQFGGDLTTNPHTGLPEAGWLGKLLPTLLGGLGMAFGIPPIWMGALGAVGGTVATGDLSKGLMMGLGAYGGASLAGGLGLTGDISKNAFGLLGNAGSGVVQGAAAAVPEIANVADLGPQVTNLGQQAASVMQPIAGVPGMSASNIAALGANSGIPTLASVPGTLASGAQTAGKGFFGAFADSAKAGLPGGIIGKVAPMLAAKGVLSGVSQAMQPSLPKYDPNAEKQTPYTPMGPGKREVQFQTPEQMRQSGGAEFTYFTSSNPAPVPLSTTPVAPTASVKPTRPNSFPYNLMKPNPDEEDNTYSYADGGAVTPPAGFQDLVSYFGATNPGAITASMYPTSAAPAPTAPAPTAGAGEKVYNFGNTAPAFEYIPPSSTNYLSDLGDLSNIDFTALAAQYGYSPTVPKTTTPAAAANTSPYSGYSPSTGSFSGIQGVTEDVLKPNSDYYNYDYTPAAAAPAVSYDYAPAVDYGLPDYSTAAPSYDYTPAAAAPAVSYDYAPAEAAPSYDYTPASTANTSPYSGYSPSTGSFSGIQGVTEDVLKPNSDYYNYDYTPAAAAPSYDYNQFMPAEAAPSYDYAAAAPSYDYNQFMPAEAAPSYDYAAAAPSYDYNQFMPAEAAPSYDYAAAAPSYDYNQFMPAEAAPSYDYAAAAPSYDYNQFMPAEAAPSYDYAAAAPSYDYSQFMPAEAAPSYDYNQFMPAEAAPSYDYNQFMPAEAAPSYDYAAAAPSYDYAAAAPSYDYNQFMPAEAAPSYDYAAAAPSYDYTPAAVSYDYTPAAAAPSYDYAAAAPSYDYAPAEAAPSYDYTPAAAAPSYDYAAAAAAPSYDYTPAAAAPSYDYTPAAAAPSYDYAPAVDYGLPDYSTAAPAVSYDYAPAVDYGLPDYSTAAPSYDYFSQYAPQPAPSYDYFSQYAPQPAPSYDYFSQYAPQPAPSYDYTPYYQPFEEQPYAMFDDLTQFAKGGGVNMGDGSFVVDARTVSELGNGSSNAGKEILARLGGRPLNGPGDGVSDSIPARIGGKQEARVARDEVIMPPQAVRRMGGGDEKRGTQKLYALMNKAHKARKKAKRGQDTKLRRGLA